MKQEKDAVHSVEVGSEGFVVIFERRKSEEGIGRKEEGVGPAVVDPDAFQNLLNIRLNWKQRPDAFDLVLEGIP